MLRLHRRPFDRNSALGRIVAGKNDFSHATPKIEVDRLVDSANVSKRRGVQTVESLWTVVRQDLADGLRKK